MLAVVTRPYPQRVAGKFVQYAWDSAAHTLALTYEPSGAAPTLVWIPPAMRPATVECGGCTYDLGEPGVRILTQAKSVTIHTK
jgi:hypothetical protein